MSHSVVSTSPLSGWAQWWVNQCTVTQCVWLSTPWTAARQASSGHGVLKQEYFQIGFSFSSSRISAWDQSLGLQCQTDSFIWPMWITHLLPCHWASDFSFWDQTTGGVRYRSILVSCGRCRIEMWRNNNIVIPDDQTNNLEITLRHKEQINGYQCGGRGTVDWERGVKCVGVRQIQDYGTHGRPSQYSLIIVNGLNRLNYNSLWAHITIKYLFNVV